MLRHKKRLIRRSIVPMVFGAMFLFYIPTSANQGKRTIVFEEARIEGKIRRPQLVLIKAQQRPSFEPMVIQGMGKEMNIVEFVSESVIEGSPYREPFSFSGTQITNYSP
ncbi:MAG: hypothetical protein GF344_03165 [Chitinivibrionales bacterium]|nr:hypothetical protein [Chitinivibrionales bacterium]MBD3356079.1 hypothetical protein [Chitinivibrionales bacterium]